MGDGWMDTDPIYIAHFKLNSRLKGKTMTKL